MRVNLGDKVKDLVTGLEGIATSRTEWLYGCGRIGVQPQEVKDGKQVEAAVIDEPQLEVLERGVIVNIPHWRDQAIPESRPRAAAGGRPDIKRVPDPAR